MKKALAMILTLTLIFCAFAIPVNAAEGPGIAEPMFKDKFDRDYPDVAEFFETGGSYYREFAYHYRSNGKPDWALVWADSGVYAEEYAADIMFGRLFFRTDQAYPFIFTYGVYNVAQDRFYDLRSIRDESLYPGMGRMLADMNIGHGGSFGADLRYAKQFLLSDDVFRNLEWEGEGSLIGYDELYYHKTDGKTDWALVKGQTLMQLDWSAYAVLGDRVFTTDTGDIPFEFDYGVYDVPESVFVPLETAYAKGTFAGLEEALDELNLGSLIGDMDGDGRLTISDATIMQRCFAEFEEFRHDDRIEGINLLDSDSGVRYLSDVNRDGIRSIRDVTQLQRILSQFE